MALWSVSETPINIRNTVLSLASGLNAFFIAYQDRFGEIDNIAYFEEYKNFFADNINWHRWRIKHLPGNHYLIGSRFSHAHAHGTCYS